MVVAVGMVMMVSVVVMMVVVVAVVVVMMITTANNLDHSSVLRTVLKAGWISFNPHKSPLRWHYDNPKAREGENKRCPKSWKGPNVCLSCLASVSEHATKIFNCPDIMHS